MSREGDRIKVEALLKEARAKFLEAQNLAEKHGVSVRMESDYEDFIQVKEWDDSACWDDPTAWDTSEEEEEDWESSWDDSGC